MGRNKCVWFVVGGERLVAGGTRTPECMLYSLMNNASRRRGTILGASGGFFLANWTDRRSIGAPQSRYKGLT